MKLVTYIGRCKSITKHGHKFTDFKKTAIMHDEVARNFENFDDFTLSDIPKNQIVPEETKKTEEETVSEVVEEANEETEELDESDLKKKKLMKLNVDTLKEMCENAGIDPVGKKEELVDKILAQ